MKTLQILILVTSHAELGATHKPTGFWLEELAVPYQTFARAGAQVTIASPQGGAAPVDPKSIESDNADVKAFRADAAAQKQLANTVKLSTIDPTKYDAIFVAGGHGVMWDLASPQVGQVLAKAYDANKVVAAVCHGPAALVKATLSNGKPLVAGKKVSAFTNEEEKGVELTNVVPFLLETTLISLGAHIEKGPMWQPYAVADGRLVTGQNPASSQKVAQLVLSQLQ